MSNVYASIAAAWAADTILNGLVPATSISQGRATSIEDEDSGEPANPAVPYVVLMDVTEDKDGQSSKARYFNQQIQITVVVDNLSTARTVQKRMRVVLDALDPDVDDGVLISWDRMAGGRAVDDGGLGRAFDTYVLLKSSNR